MTGFNSTKGSNHHLHVLVVDDEPAIRNILQEVLEVKGHDVTAAPDGSSALRMYSEQPFDAVLLDIKMPGMSGMDVLRQLRATDPDAAVVMATAMQELSTAVQCLRDGASDYVTKPVDFNEIVIATERAAERRRLIHENREYQQELEEKVAAQVTQIRHLMEGSFASLARALDAKDHYTQGHSDRVTCYALAIGDATGLPLEMMRHLHRGASVHDLGKIGVRDAVLKKEGKLTDEEYEEIKAHPVIGEEIVSQVIREREVLQVIRNHHERIDGRGYPDRLAGEAIPYLARIVAIADTYDAMTSTRSYRPAMPPEKAASIISDVRGTQLDTALADAFLSTVFPAIQTGKVALNPMAYAELLGEK